MSDYDQRRDDADTERYDGDDAREDEFIARWEAVSDES